MEQKVANALPEQACTLNDDEADANSFSTVVAPLATL